MEKKYFRFEPKQTKTRSVSRLFRFVSVCFVKPKNFFRFVSVFRTFIETTETNITVSKRTETIQNFLKNPKICSLNTTNLLRLRIKQKEAIRVINSAGYRDHTQPLLKKNKILPLDSMTKYSNLRFMHSYFPHNLPFSF